MGSLTAMGMALVLSLLILQSAEGTGSCGERKLAAAALIAHGYKARPGAWPWHGELFSRDEYGSTSYRCGVTILTKQFVLSTAHCAILSAKMFFVRVGISNLLLPEEHMRQFGVNKVIRHEEFDEITLENDISLLKLSGEITYTSYIQPVCLWQGDTKLSKIDSKLGFVAGWRFIERGYNSDSTISRSWWHGVLIHPSFLITTARCVSPKEDIKFSAWINELPLDNEKDSMENDDERVIHFSRIPVRDTFAHPDFDTPKYANDIALVKLERPTTANPICPPSLDPLNLYDATKFHFIGSDMHKKTQNFRMDAQLVDLIACQSKFIEHGFNVTLTRGQVCSTLVDKNDNIDESSFGLLSAPMQYAKTGFFGEQYFLTAFASFGIRDLLLSEFPTVFTNVVHYSDWIRERIMQN